MKELLIAVPGLLSSDQVADAVATAIRIDAIVTSVTFPALIIGGLLLAFTILRSMGD